MTSEYITPMQIMNTLQRPVKTRYAKQPKQASDDLGGITLDRRKTS